MEQARRNGNVQLWTSHMMMMIMMQSSVLVLARLNVGDAYNYITTMACCFLL